MMYSAAHRYTTLVLALLFVLALCACGRTAVGMSGPSAPRPASSTTLLNQTPLNSVTMVDYTSPNNTPQLMCGFPLVAVATVSGFGVDHWNTADGQRPASVVTQADAAAGSYEIYTPLRFSQFSSLVDHRAQAAATIEYAVEGGRVGADSQLVIPVPNFQQGNRYVVVFTDGIIAGNPAIHSQHTLLAVGAFLIDHNDIVTLQPARQADAQGNPAVAAITMSLNQLAAALSQCR